MRNGFRVLIATSLLLGASLVQALGLGEPSVKSFLNQPLEVEIELLSLTMAEAESVTARLASLEDYQRVGIGQLRLSVPLSFSVFATSARTFVLVESSEAVHDPVVQLLLDVRWSGGRLLKEYTIFLDPPTLDLAPPRISRQAPAAIEEPPGRVETTPPETRPVTAPRPSAVPGIDTSGEIYGPVQGGETLWRIASNWVIGSGYSINQAMISIALANPQAFRNGNINRLQRGALLRLPDGTEVGRISRAEATQEVADQIDAWRRNIPLSQPPPVVSEAGSDIDAAADVDTGEVIDADAGVQPDTTAQVAPPQLPAARLELLASELDRDDRFGGDITSREEQRAQLSLVQELLHRAETAMRKSLGGNEALVKEIEELRATVLELSRIINLNDADLAALAARTRAARSRDKDDAPEGRDDLRAQGREIGDDQDAGVAGSQTTADIPVLTGPSAVTASDGRSTPSWWEQTWFIVTLAGMLLAGIVLLLRRGTRIGPADYGQRSLADALIEEEEEHVDYSAADIPGVEPETAEDDLSTLTEEAENILKSLEEENLEERRQDPDSIYEVQTQPDEITVEEDGTTVSTLNMDEDELSEFLAEKRTQKTDAVEADEGGDEDQEDGRTPETEDAMESRLDQAIACIESEDHDKARVLLEEVQESGDEQQQEKAKKLLDKL